MAYINADRIKETTTTTGTGPLTLAGTVVGFRAFSAAMASADTCSYAVVSATGTDWETGIGTFTSPSTLTRTTVQSSSNANAAVAFGAGLKDVFIGPIAGTQIPWNPNGTGALNISVDALNDVAITTPTVNQVLKYDGTAWTNQADAVNVGTVTSVGISGGATGLSVSGSPIITNGVITIAGTVAVGSGGTGQTTAQAAINTLAGGVTSAQYLRGTGTNVVMSAIQAADVPTLNQSTTGNAATVSTNANLTGHITSVGNAAVLGSFTSAQLAGALSDETGTGAAVFANSPTLVTPFSNALSAVPVSSGPGNSLTITAGNGAGIGIGGNLILNPGEQGTSGGRGGVLIDGLNAGKGKGGIATNTAFGLNTLSVNTTGDENTTIGANSLSVNTTGYHNTTIGSTSLYQNTTGYSNAAIGAGSLYQNTTGYHNTAIGYLSLLTNTTGYSNTAIGSTSGRSVTTGANNTFLGNYAGYNGSQLATASNSMALGNGTFTTASNQVVIGNTSVTETVLNGTVVANSGVVRTTALIVATLPAAATAGAGARAFVTDALAPTFAAIVATGGAVPVPVYSDGTNWRVG